jgi:hypothetical protein
MTYVEWSVIAGGFQNRLRTPTVSAELDDLFTGAFAPTGNMTVPQAGHTATLLADGKVLIAGGHNGSGTACMCYF